MLRSQFYLYDVNSISKLIGLILFIAGITYIQEAWYLTIFHVVSFLLTEEYPYLRKMAIVGIGVGLVSILFPQLLWINKLICILLYLCFLIKITKLEQVKYFIETLFYQFQNSKITSFFVFILYFTKEMKKNYRRIENIRKSYGLEKNSEFFKRLWKQAFFQTKTDVKELMMIHKMRFYNTYPKRTYLEKEKWELWDVYYLMSHVLLLIFSTIIGR